MPPGPQSPMKNILVAAVVCVAVTYGVDVYWFNGQYYGALVRLISNTLRHFR